ncbi:MAG: sigma-54-dependent Fis family transcriptional regulator [Deltaproteobacteria bacterium]|nr:sigma-54-dependent Fis family transcriptional regulator [Deltaproteobacteria bacterium]
MPRILVVDDERSVQESLRMLFKLECDVDVASNADEALARVAAAPPDLILLDLVMPGRSGLDVLAELPEPRPPVIVLTATRTVATAVEAMKRGAADYVIKPFEIEALRMKVRQLLEHQRLTEEVTRLRAQVDARESYAGMIGKSDVMQEVFRNVERAAPSEASVLLRGASGTGKELVAQALHEQGPRKAEPFVAVNCAALPEALIESELFGHEKGAFTGAHEARVGKFEQAGAGTLFLDEIGELSPHLQAKLLRALEARCIQRVGGEQSIAVRARLVCATNRELEAEVAAGRFREDLYYRIHVVPIDLPPLADRREDIRPLAEHFLARARDAAGRGPARITRAALATLERYAWPGNVRELRNAIERAVVLGDGERVDTGDLSEAIVRGTQVEHLRDGVREGRLELEAAVEQFEAELVREALIREGWNQTRAAERLGVTRRTLKIRMDRYGFAAP